MLDLQGTIHVTTPHAATYTGFKITRRVCPLSNEARITKCFTVFFFSVFIFSLIFFFLRGFQHWCAFSGLRGTSLFRHDGSMFARQTPSCNQRCREPDPVSWEGMWWGIGLLGLEVSVKKPRPSDINWLRIRGGGGKRCLGLLESMWNEGRF